MNKYTKLSKTKKGAILFLVSRGKYSEGYDFKGNLSRAIFIIGIPYINCYDVGV